MSKMRVWFYCLLAGTAYALSVSNLIDGIPWGLFAWIALLPLHRALTGATTSQAFWRGWLAGFLAFIGTMYWVVTAMHLYGKVPLPISIVLMLLLAGYLGLYVGLYAWGFVRLEQRWPAATWVAAPCLWVSLEYIRTHAFSGLPWGLLSYSQFQWLSLIQVANITGVYGVSFLIVLVNVSVFLFVRRVLIEKPRHTFRPWLPLAVTVATFLGVWLYGMSQLHVSPVDRLTIGIVQPNIDQAHKWDQAYRVKTLEQYRRLTETVSPQSELILWPEAATPFLFEQEPAYQSLVTGMTKNAEVPLVLGSPTLRRQSDGTPYLLNSAYLLNPSGEISGRYDKQHLVPFGEYIPLQRMLFFLDKLVVGIGDFEPGPGPTLLDFERGPDRRKTRFGVAICFEVIFPDLVRRLALEGANFLVTITNDAWFGNTVAPHQHFGMVVFRAVENRMAFARAANTGVSGFIDPTGRILMTTPIFAERAVIGSIPLSTPSTVYTRFGDVFAWTCVIMALILLSFARFFSRPVRG
ncbi:MAG: apolipoprotein N-acyltransferase [Nitrospira sp. SB0677_bin_15]|nr:apolipoprotein N-acyltransferase [Nitrospira sp. SB0667_bin_9]MYG41354.1 apolipoprotein N-acyltransferase [Nitrospira sp. SB0677_bin_15]MYH01873.1 apolipoprotein N-acyltransferase [Nitrospira sp. SB0675_bin_23]MYJ22726.1 apolipoprotein N-acyltransferase [Nitrospira sp. SB0673_bin_12]